MPSRLSNQRPYQSTPPGVPLQEFQFFDGRMRLGIREYAAYRFLPSRATSWFEGTPPRMVHLPVGGSNSQPPGSRLARLSSSARLARERQEAPLSLATASRVLARFGSFCCKLWTRRGTLPRACASRISRCGSHPPPVWLTGDCTRFNHATLGRGTTDPFSIRTILIVNANWAFLSQKFVIDPHVVMLGPNDYCDGCDNLSPVI